jgi:hypothetical protein
MMAVIEGRKAPAKGAAKPHEPKKVCKGCKNERCTGLCRN